MQLLGTWDPEQFTPGERVQIAGFIAAAQWKFGKALYTPHLEGWPMMGVVAERGRFRAWGRLPRPFGRAALRATESSGRQDLNPDDELAYAWLTGQRVSFTASVRRWRHLDGMLFYTNPHKAELTALAAPAVRADLVERLPGGQLHLHRHRQQSQRGGIDRQSWPVERPRQARARRTGAAAQAFGCASAAR
jgi:hypothetical protein